MKEKNIKSSDINPFIVNDKKTDSVDKNKSDDSLSTVGDLNDSELKGFNFNKIPNSSNYRSAQLTKDLFPKVIKKYGIKNVIRFNGDGGDATHGGKVGPSIDEERKICESMGCNFYTKGKSTEDIWKYTTQYNSWNKMVKNNPNSFVNGGFLRQAQKFGVKDLDHAKKLAGTQ